MSVWRQHETVDSVTFVVRSGKGLLGLSFAESLNIRSFLICDLLLKSSEDLLLSATVQDWPVRPPASARLIAQSRHSTSRRSSAASSAVERLFVDYYFSTILPSGTRNIFVLDQSQRVSEEEPSLIPESQIMNRPGSSVSSLPSKPASCLSSPKWTALELDRCFCCSKSLLKL